MLDAARLYEEVPVTIKLRELQTLAEIAREKNMIVVTTTTEVGQIAAMSKAFAKK